MKPLEYCGIEEKRIEPNVIRRRAVRSGVDGSFSIFPKQIWARNREKLLEACVVENENKFFTEGGIAKVKITKVEKIVFTGRLNVSSGRSKRDIIRDFRSGEVTPRASGK